MALADTADYDELVLEVEFTAESGTYTKVCGVTDVNINRANNTDVTMVPDCDDESKPFQPKRSVVSQDVTISATGFWAVSSNKAMRDWFTSGGTKNVRITNARVTAAGATGDPETETIPMILAALNNARTKGQQVTAEIELQQNGPVTVGTKSA